MSGSALGEQLETISAAAGGWSELLPFDQFSPSSGSLSSVGLNLTGTVFSFASIENLGASSATVEIDMPGAMPRVVRLMMHVETARPRAEIRHVYLHGAKALRLDDQTGSLTPGKRADLILVRTQSLNLGVTPNATPYRQMISAQTEDVDTVIVDGRVLKRGGKLIGIDTPTILREAAESIAGLRKRANWPEGAL